MYIAPGVAEPNLREWSDSEVRSGTQRLPELSTGAGVPKATPGGPGRKTTSAVVGIDRRQGRAKLPSVAARLQNMTVGLGIVDRRAGLGGSARRLP